MGARDCTRRVCCECHRHAPNGRKAKGTIIGSGIFERADYGQARDSKARGISGRSEDIRRLACSTRRCLTRTAATLDNDRRAESLSEAPLLERGRSWLRRSLCGFAERWSSGRAPEAQRSRASSAEQRRAAQGGRAGTAEQSGC